MVRATLPLQNLTETPESFPELTIKELTDDQAKALVADGMVEDAGWTEQPGQDENEGRIVVGEE